MTNTSSENEIDLLDLFFKIKNRILTILFTTIFAISLAYFFLANQDKPKIIAKIKISPISVLEESKYKIYNSFVKSIKSYSMSKFDNVVDKNYEINSGDEIFVPNTFINSSTVEVPQSVVENLLINNVNKEFLYGLFVTQLNENSNLLDNFKRFTNIENNENFNKPEFKKAFKDMVSTLKVKKNDKENFSYIEIKVDEAEILKDLLYFLETLANQEIHKKLNIMFNNYIKFINQVKQIQLEDLNFKYSIANKEEQRHLNYTRELVKSDKYVNRLKKIYSDSPLSDDNKFYAATILNNPIKIEEPNQNKFKFLFLAGLLGLLLGIFISLILNTIAKRS